VADGGFFAFASGQKSIEHQQALVHPGEMASSVRTGALFRGEDHGFDIAQGDAFLFAT